MLKLPFIEKTFVGVEISNTSLHWIEVNKLGSRLSIVSNGSIEIEESVESAVESLKNHISSDAYYLGVGYSEILTNVEIEDVTILDDDREKWIQSYSKQRASKQSDTDKTIVTEFVDIDEDLIRVINLTLDTGIISELLTIFEQSELILLYITSGLLESGYSQILNPEFIDGFSSTYYTTEKNSYLVVYKQGKTFQVHEIGESDSNSLTIQQCDSILKSEEVSNDIPLDSIPILSRYKLEDFKLERPIKRFEFSKFSGSNELSDCYVPCMGIVMKLAFPQLDHIPFKEEASNKVKWEYEKKELIRLSILLFVPVIFFSFITFAANKIIETSLFELNQINTHVSGNLDIIDVEEKRAAILQAEFQSLKSSEEEKIYFTKSFETLATIIPEEVWITDYQAKLTDGQIEALLEGVSTESNSISTFQGRFQNHESTSTVQLLSSELINANGIATSNIKFSIKVVFK